MCKAERMDVQADANGDERLKGMEVRGRVDGCRRKSRRMKEEE